jgi:peptidoglycan-N-acetylglucosamine deacetylase
MTRCFNIALPVITLIIFSCGEQTKVENTREKDTTQVTAATPAPPDTVNIPSLVTEQSPGVLRLTAQNGKPLGPDIKYMPEWKAFGWFTDQDSVEWEIDVPAAGEYKVQMEWSVSDEEAGKEFILKANNDQLTGKVDKSGSWETFKTKDVGDISLEQGKQKIVFRSNTRFKEGAILDLRELKLEKNK